MDDRLAQLVRSNGRLRYKGLVSLIHRVAQLTFVSFCDRPFLVGKELIQGNLSQGTSDASQTMSFRPNYVLQEDKNSEKEGQKEAGSGPDSSIGRAIFAFRKAPYSETPRGVFSVGREEGNDLVIADYSVSKKHAEIREKARADYFIKDVNSTNGTFLDGERLTPHTEMQIQRNSEIVFGRLEFVFTLPGDLYQMIQSGG